MTNYLCAKGWVETLVNGRTSVRGRLINKTCCGYGYDFIYRGMTIAQFCGTSFKLNTNIGNNYFRIINIFRKVIPDGMLVEVKEITPIKVI